MSYLSPRFIIRGQAPEAEVDSYARAHDWPKVVDVARNADTGEVRSIEWEITGAARLKYFEDDATDRSYFFIEAAQSNLCLSMTRHAVAEIPVYTRSQLFRAFDTSVPGSSNRRESLLMAALGAPQEYDTEVHQRITEGLGDDEAEVRSAALYAMSYSPAPEYLPTLRSIAENDLVEQVRNEAQEMLEIFSQVGIGEA